MARGGKTPFAYAGGPLASNYPLTIDTMLVQNVLSDIKKFYSRVALCQLLRISGLAQKAIGGGGGAEICTISDNRSLLPASNPATIPARLATSFSLMERTDDDGGSVMSYEIPSVVVRTARRVHFGGPRAWIARAHSP